MNNEYLEYAFYLYIIDNKKEKGGKFNPIYKLEDMVDNLIYKKYIDEAIKKIRKEKIRNILHNA